MLQTLNYSSLDELIDDTIPQNIRSKKHLSGEPVSELRAVELFRQLMDQNEIFRCHLGQGFYPTITPTVILRNLIENPLWYTPYTPYQAEISQGRLEMLLNFQTMVSDLTGLPVANSSLLDEATAAAEAMTMTFGGSKKKVFLIDENVYSQTIEVCKTRAKAIGIEVRVSKSNSFEFEEVFGCLIQYPDTYGSINDFSSLTQKAHSNDCRIIVAADLLALTLLKPPGEWGADVVVGNSQRFGVPMGYGGPHAAFFATTESFKRKLPGRIIGVSKDARDKPALRMAMQTREQHIRRDKATSNICTAQALLANTAAAYAIYHGPNGIKNIADHAHKAASIMACAAQQMGFKLVNEHFFDTVHIDVGKGNANELIYLALKNQINLRQATDSSVTIAFDETTTDEHLADLFSLFSQLSGKQFKTTPTEFTKHIGSRIPTQLSRRSPYLQHPVFNSYHSETSMLRYLHKLASKDLSLATAMIPLGSCTMKLNATSEMIPITFPKVNSLHPYVSASQVRGYERMLHELTSKLCELTGFAAMSFQPNAGSQGEYAGLLAIAAYHKSKGNENRTICLIPASAHGTNPASAVMAGFKVVVVKCDAKGGVAIEDLKSKLSEHKKNLGCLMVTYPSTFGVFEESIAEICKMVHEHGGLVYMDGANMNAQVGLCSPGEIGADVCHLNLHKTFCIPHGGGGPGMGPIGVAAHLAPFLPSHPFKLPFDPSRDSQFVGPISAAPFSSASILPISYMYIAMMGGVGLTLATKIAILNANYMAKRLERHYNVLYRGAKGNVAHEFIIDLRPFKNYNVTEEDVAKRLIDFNFHAPTMSWPVAGTLMIEPTESESLYELDRLCDALIVIRQEIQEIIDGKVDEKNNVLKNAPHTAEMCLSDEWKFPYKREKAAYPLDCLRYNKFWPTVARLDNVFGDRNVVCTCPPIEQYQ